MPTGDSVDLRETAAVSRGCAGTVWTLAGSEDLNANLVRFPVGPGVEEHVNDEVDVLVLGVSGEGKVVVEGEEHPLSAGVLVFVPRGARRSIRGSSEGFAYLSVHRKRGGMRIGRRGETGIPPAEPAL